MSATTLVSALSSVETNAAAAAATNVADVSPSLPHDSVDPSSSSSSSSSTSDSSDHTSNEANPSSNEATTTTTASDSSSSSSSSTSPAATSAAATISSDSPKNLELTISAKGLTEFPTALMLERVNDIVKIDATDNQLTSLSSLPSLPRVHTLILDKNRLTTLDALQSFPTLTTLWLNNNQLADLATTLAHIARACPHLTYLSMLRNPCCPNMYFSDGEAESYQRYRIFVIYRLPSLCFLDATPVTQFERDEASARGKFYAVSRPSEDPLYRSVSNLAVSASLLLAPSTGVVRVGFDATTREPPKVTSFLGKGRPRYDGSNSEGNRFIVNDDL